MKRLYTHLVLSEYVHVILYMVYLFDYMKTIYVPNIYHSVAIFLYMYILM